MKLMIVVVLASVLLSALGAGWKWGGTLGSGVHAAAPAATLA